MKCKKDGYKSILEYFMLSSVLFSVGIYFYFSEKITIKLRAESDHVKTLCPAGREAGEMKEKEGRRLTGGHNVVYNPTNFDQNLRLSLACVDHPDQRTGIKRCFDLRIIRTLISKLTKLYIVTDCHNFMMDSDIFDNGR